MRYLPMSYNTKDKNALVLGGGLLALSRIRKLLDTEFNIYIIAASFVDEIKKLSEDYPEKVFIKETELKESFMFFSYDYVLIATNDFNLNLAFEERCKNSNISYERVDILSDSELIMNEVIEKNNIKIGLDTHRLNPSLVEIIKSDIEEFLNKYSKEKFDILDDIRRELVRKNTSNIDEIIKDLYFNEKISLDTYLEDLKNNKIKEDEKDLEDFIDDVGKNESSSENSEEKEDSKDNKAISDEE